MLEMFTEARGVAVVGASTSPEKLGYQVLHNVIQYGYEGAIYPINPTAPEILGHKAYASVIDCPDPVDLAVILVPNKAVPGVLEQCGQRGLKGAVIITAGFGAAASANEYTKSAKSKKIAKNECLCFIMEPPDRKYFWYLL